MEETLGKQVETLFESEAVRKAVEAHRQKWVEFLARWGKMLQVAKGTVQDVAPTAEEPTGFEEF